jgi:hypothetical protein
LIAEGVGSARKLAPRLSHSERRRLTLEALADADAKRVIEHAEVEAWAEGLGRRRG